MEEYGIRGAVNRACSERRQEIDEWHDRETNNLIESMLTSEGGGSLERRREFSRESEALTDEYEALTEELREN